MKTATWSFPFGGLTLLVLVALPWSPIGCTCDGMADLCPSDPDKTEPGLCGCGVPDTDSDGDGTSDCDDVCPVDASDNPPSDYTTVQLENLVASPDLYDGMSIVVGGTAGMDASAVVCTEEECSPEDPCCNACSASITITGPDGQIILRSGIVVEVGCDGSNCDYMDNCTPLEPESEYVAWGIFTAAVGEGRLALDGFCTP